MSQVSSARERDFEQHKTALLAELDRQIASMQEQQAVLTAACRALRWRRWIGSLIDGWRNWRWRFGEWRARP